MTQQLLEGETLSFTECCDRIWRNRYVPALNHAARYAMAGMSMTDPISQKVQALYILNNITRWRGIEGALVRASLKKIGGVK